MTITISWPVTDGRSKSITVGRPVAVGRTSITTSLLTIRCMVTLRRSVTGWRMITASCAAMIKITDGRATMSLDTSGGGNRLLRRRCLNGRRGVSLQR